MKVFLFFLIFFLGILSFLYWAQHNSLAIGEFQAEKGQNETLLERELGAIQEVRVMSWNLAFVHGVGSEGVNYIPKEKKEYEEKLEKMARVISENKVDILLLQEVDWESQRSHYIDQVRELGIKANLPFYSKALSWELNYLAFPYWPISHHFGRIKSGGAILSRFPIKESSYKLFSKPKRLPWWYQPFYLYRYVQMAEIEINEKNFLVFNHHLEAFDKENRQENAKESIGFMRNFISQTDAQVLVYGGDFNAIESEAPKVQGYEDDKTIEFMNFLESFSSSLTGTSFTYSSHDLDRKLDYLFVKKENLISSRVVSEAQELSDHLPILVKIRIN